MRSRSMLPVSLLRASVTRGKHIRRLSGNLSGTQAQRALDEPKILLSKDTSLEQEKAVERWKSENGGIQHAGLAPG